MSPLLLAFLAIPAATAADVPSFWGRESVAVAGWPTGLLSTTIAEVRVPLHRSKSIVFQSTSAGLGVQVQAAPAFVVVGPRLSFAPIDVFEVNLKAARGWFFGNGLGLMPFDELSGTLSQTRADREAEGFGSQMWLLGVEPTVKAKVWKLVMFDSWTIDYLDIERPAGIDSPYTYEALRDLVISFEEVTFEHQAGVLFEAMPGGDKPSLRFGPTYRDRWALNSKDRSAAVGVLVAAKPGVKPAVPTLVGLALWYVVDNDRVGPIPFLAAQARWEVDVPLGKRSGI
ncbi:MAG: hypothetical protein Q7U06_00275 [Pseudomonadota bacterium]|nr:hypothetical protein [Pseudomonadota bacterium]